MPGADPRESASLALGELALPFLPELPARGVGADRIGRTGALLVELPVDLVHRTYRLVDHPNSTTRRIRDYLRWDIDALEEAVERGGRPASGAVLARAVGPLSLAAAVELRGGHKIVTDPGAVRDVSASLTEGLRQHCADLRRRTRSDVLVHLDESDLGRVVDGRVPPLTRLDPIRAVPAPEAAQLLQELINKLGVPVLLHTGSRPRWDVLHRLTGVALAMDVTTLRPDVDYDSLGAFLDGGGVLAAGAVPAVDPETPIAAAQLARGLTELIDQIGLDRKVLATSLIVTPTDGLAQASATWARRALAMSTEVAAGLASDPEF